MPDYEVDLRRRLEIAENNLYICKTVIREISWQARRYSDGRQTYAPGQFNSAIRMLDENGLGDLHQGDPAENNERFASDKPKHF